MSGDIYVAWLEFVKPFYGLEQPFGASAFKWGKHLIRECRALLAMYDVFNVHSCSVNRRKSTMGRGFRAYVLGCKVTHILKILQVKRGKLADACTFARDGA